MRHHRFHHAGKSKSKFKGIVLYIDDVLFHVEWCIRQLWSSSIITFNITGIAFNHYTDNYPLLNIFHHTERDDADESEGGERRRHAYQDSTPVDSPVHGLLHNPHRYG